MIVEVDKACLLDGELFDAKSILKIENVESIRITRNNRYVGINTKENHGLNCILVDILKYNLSVYDDKSSK